jgi:hypothetical protein
MPLLHESSDAKKFDTRMVERNITRGIVPASDADKASASLADDGANAEWINIEVIAAGDGIRKVPSNGTPEATAILESIGSPIDES